MDERTRERLEYTTVVGKVTEYASTYIGKAKAQALQPLTELGAVRSVLAETAEAAELLRLGAHVPLPSLTGMETFLRLAGTGYVYTEEELGALQTFLAGCGQLRRYMDGKRAQAPRVASYASSLYELSDLKREIDRCIRHGRVDNSASAELAKARRRIAAAEDKMKKRLEALLAKYKSILMDRIVSKRGDRYVLPVKKEHRRLIAGAVMDESGSGQTVFVEPAELAALHYELGDLRAEEAREEMKVLARLSELVETYAQELELNAEAVGAYDVLFAKAKYSLAIGGVPVGTNDEGVTVARNAKHPLLGPSMVPLDFEIGCSFRTLVITGPNTGGKTVALKTIGLLTLMVQTGLLVPAAPDSVFAVFRRIAADIGDGQSLEQSLSTFSAHVKHLVDMLRSADRSTLALIDEMASGTDPGEGVGLSIAVLEELYRKGATVVATTHFNEIKRFAAAAPGFENARMAFDAETLEPLYRLRIGEAGHSYAFAIASKLGMPAHVLVRSRELTEGARRRSSDDAAAYETAADLPKFVPGGMAEALRTDSAPSGAALDAGPDAAPSLASGALPGKAADADPGAPSGAALGSAPASQPGPAFEVGDSVYIPSLGKYGIVYAAADKAGEVGVMVQKEKLKLGHKRLKPHISRRELYPDDYDFDIVFDTKENRKKRKLMSKRHVEGLTIVRSMEEDS